MSAEQNEGQKSRKFITKKLHENPLTREKMRDARSKSHITQEELARKLKRTNVGDLERGTTNLQPEHLAGYAEATKKHVEQLYGRDRHILEQRWRKNQNKDAKQEGTFSIRPAYRKRDQSRKQYKRRIKSILYITLL
jgi:transcriptional regulator with XRE-family HTH domain